MNYQEIYPQLLELTEDNRKGLCTSKKKHFLTEIVLIILLRNSAKPAAATKRNSTSHQCNFIGNHGPVTKTRVLPNWSEGKKIDMEEK